MSEDTSFSSLFQQQYIEFADELEETFPELEPSLRVALALSEEDRHLRFIKEVLPAMSAVQSGSAEPSVLLPGVTLGAGTWRALSENNKKSILSYLGLLCSCAMFSGDISGIDMAGWKGASSWYEDMMKQWETKAKDIDWASMTSKISSIFGIGLGGSDTDASGGGFKLPEKFMKGHLARLVEELMADFKPEDFGFDEDEIKKLEGGPAGEGAGAGAIEMLMKVYMKNPDIIQKIVERVGNRLKQKIMSGSINPKMIAAEAEELMKEFTENPQFRSLLETMKGMFGFEDMDMARAAGREGSARLAAARDRLRKKLNKKRAAGTEASGDADAEGAEADDVAAAAAAAMPSIAELLASINSVGKKNKKK